jgi:hypothetical protein
MRAFVVLSVACLTFGCAGRFDPASFEGTREPRRAEPEAIALLTASTNELTPLGAVRASCTLEPGFRKLDDEQLSDVDCSSERLLWALRESAANAGGQALVGARCTSRRLSTTAREAYRVGCTGRVVRYRSAALSALRPLNAPRAVPPGTPAPSASDVARIDEPDASLAFRISVRFEPSVADFASAPLPGASVHELSRMPLSHRPLGDLVTTCEQCDERALRYGVLLAAGRLGAPDVVGVRCYREGEEQSCVGTLAAPERAE